MFYVSYNVSQTWRIDWMQVSANLTVFHLVQLNLWRCFSSSELIKMTIKQLNPVVRAFLWLRSTVTRTSISYKCSRVMASLGNFQINFAAIFRKTQALFKSSPEFFLKWKTALSLATKRYINTELNRVVWLYLLYIFMEQIVSNTTSWKTPQTLT